jgi:predicted O-linked N-acetylglucosamine transferase (SPINDLY family)
MPDRQAVARLPVISWLPGGKMQAEQAKEQFRQAAELHRQGRLNQAQSLYEEILENFPQHADTLHMLGILATQSGRTDKAVQLIDEAIAIVPRKAAYHASLGNAYKALGRMESAIACFDRAVFVDPRLAAAHYNRGTVLQAIDRLEAAINSYNEALAVNPRYAKALMNRGVALQGLRRYAEAIESYDLALAIDPGYAKAHMNRGTALLVLGQPTRAIEAFEMALTIEPDNVNVHYNRGNAFHDIGHLETALECYASAIDLNPEYDYLPGLVLHTRMKICDWQGHESERSRLLEKVRRGEKSASGLAVLALTDDPGIQRKAAETWIQDRHRSGPASGTTIGRSTREKIRIGYFSADFREHPVSYLTAGIYEKHDRSRFEVYAFSFGAGTENPMRARLELAFDRFIDLRNESDATIAQRSRELDIDIAVDLGGLTTGARTGIFAARAAPVQLNYLGYPGTMGAEYIDYLIADSVIVPEAARDGYSEKVVYLPCFQPGDDCREAAEHEFTREELGLPQKGFVFCNFNNNYKITPEVFDDWMHILGETGDSVLLLLQDNEWVARNLKATAEKRGVDPGRVVFAGRLPYREYLARYRAADLFLDTFPFNGGTTVSDALWAGLPVLTLGGRSFASRMAASILSAAGMPELITGERSAYRSLAVDLASQPLKLKDARSRLNRSCQTAPVFDTGQYTRNLEEAYLQMAGRYRAGLPPEDIYIA